VRVSDGKEKTPNPADLCRNNSDVPPSSPMLIYATEISRFFAEETFLGFPFPSDERSEVDVKECRKKKRKRKRKKKKKRESKMKEKQRRKRKEETASHYHLQQTL
jgi:hypothetical protein